VSRLVLSLNAGSSTLKYGLYRFDESGERELMTDTLETRGSASAEIVGKALERVEHAAGSPLQLVGHRVVHGGDDFVAPTRVDRHVLERLHALSSLAPLHLPPALDILRAATERLPNALHVACFDTAFHRTLPEVARRFALPDELYRSGVRRYGFHGISYEYVLSTFESVPERLIVAHLGNGASVTAIEQGRSIDTSMGFTPDGGIPMGTRPGDLDPGVLLYLERERGLDLEQREQLIHRESGLRGVGGTSDMRELVARAEKGESRAIAAIELFSYALKKQIGAYVAALGGLDCLVFTGGIGEHAPRVRELACAGLSPLGIELDPALNASCAPLISRPEARCAVRIVSTNEDWVIARATFQLANEPQH